MAIRKHSGVTLKEGNGIWAVLAELCASVPQRSLHEIKAVVAHAPWNHTTSSSQQRSTNHHCCHSTPSPSHFISSAGHLSWRQCLQGGLPRGRPGDLHEQLLRRRAVAVSQRVVHQDGRQCQAGLSLLCGRTVRGE